MVGSGRRGRQERRNRRAVKAVCACAAQRRRRGASSVCGSDECRRVSPARAQARRSKMNSARKRA